MKLSTKLIGGSVVILALALLLGGSSAFLITNLSHSVDYTVNVVAKRRMLASDVYTAALKMQSLDRAIMLKAIVQQGAGAEDIKREYRDVASGVRKSLADYQTLIEDENSRLSYEAVRTAIDQLTQAHDELLQYMEKQQFDQVQKVSDEKVMPRAESVTADARQLMQRDVTRMQTAADDAKSKGTTAQWLLVFLTVVCLAVGGVVVMIVRSVSRTLRDLASAMAEGAAQVSAAASQVAAVSQSLAQSSSEQAASLEETSASGHDLAAMTKKNLDHTQRASESVSETDRQVHVANETIEKMVGSMLEINNSSNKISKIIRVIDEIAFQTNILALNAAVEAARAGEAGMGFAVVADEVRNLAQRCAQAAKDTSSLIEESIQTANEGSDRLNRVVEAIQGINQQASKVKELVDDVNSSSQEQSRHIEQISAAVAQMEKVTQNTAASAEEGASAGQQLNAHADSMRSAVGQLYALVGGSDDQALRNLHSKTAVGREMSAAAYGRNRHAGPPDRARHHSHSMPPAVGKPVREFPLDSTEFAEF